MEKCRLAYFPLPNCICCPWKEAARRSKKSLTPTCQRRGRAGGFDLASLFALPPRYYRPLPLSSPNDTAARRCHVQTPKRIQRMEERTCVLFPLLCASGQQTFHLTSAAATTVQRQEEPINCPFLFGLSSLFCPPPTSTPHQTLIACSARLTNVKLKRKNCCCCKETPGLGIDHHLSLEYPRQLVGNKTARE